MNLDFKKKPLSWSQISSFEYDPAQWYERYVLGKKQKETKEMEWGKAVGKLLETVPEYLKDVPRYKNMEYELRVPFEGIPAGLVGFVDTADIENKRIREYKTGKKAWTQKRVDSHGQIDMYLLMIYLQHKIPPEEMTVHLDWLPTQDNGDFSITFVEPVEVHTFQTKRTMADILRFGKRIKDVYKQMEKLSPTTHI